ncbi:translocase of chloroplast 159 [Cucumis melo var. makuwa]|uniref:Translocase of chloroplast 159 n=2 Tax=Cucumis melo TaxID=3656 RepID=A0A5A7TT25_CUCMM|nr:translocase of chloroplast 159, chloroplastic-like [Cucumis melo]KAA0044369.1 translocase of chloroplast 159 [Cucumis melo var. makuwa]
MDSMDLAQQPSQQNSVSSGSSSTSSSSFTSSTVDSHVDTPSLDEPEMGVAEIKTSVVADGGGSDGAGSETEGFLSGEEEFESASDRPIVGYPEEESLGKSAQGADTGTSFVGYSQLSAPVSVRPIAKVSVDSDVEEEDEEEEEEEDDLQVDENLRGKEEIEDKVGGEDVFVESKKGKEVEVPVEKEETIVVSDGNKNLDDVVNDDDDASQVQERTIELSGNSKEGNVPESLVAEDVGSVPEESVDGGKQVSEGDELNDVTVKQSQNEASDGKKEAELDKETLASGKQAGKGIDLSEKVVAEDVEQLKEQETPGSSSDEKAVLGDQASSKLVKLADEKQEEETSAAEKQVDVEVKLNDTVAAAEDGEQLKNLETDSPVDDKIVLADDENSKVLEPADGGQEAEMDEGSPVAEMQADGEIRLKGKVDAEDGELLIKLEPVSFANNKADEFTASALDDKTLHESSQVSATDVVGNPEEIKDLENKETADLAHGATKLDNGFDNVGHEVNEETETVTLADSPSKAGNEKDSKDDSKIREDVPGDVEPEPSQEDRSLVKESIPDNASVKDSGISDAPKLLEPVLSEVDGEKHPLDEEGDIEGSGTDGETEGEIFGSSEAAREFLQELERASGAGSHSGAESSIDHSQRIDGQIVTDSDEADTDDEGDGKELFDSAALAALLKAARDAGSDGGPITVTTQDGSRLFSIERPAGLGSSLISGKNASRPSRPLTFASSNSRVGDDAENKLSEEEKTKLQKLQQIRVKFLRLVQRLGVSPDDSLVAQVLYRFGLVAGRSTGQLFSFDNAKNTAIQLEAEGKEDLDFSLNILVLGKSGVGKSATINSIFGEDKTPIHAFGPGTTTVKEIIGTVEGVKIRVFDSPGLRSSSSERRINNRILSSIKNVMKKYPPDIVLYVDRLDNQTRDLNDLLLLRSVSSSLGSSIWKNAIITLTHAASAPPDGPSGSPLGYEVFVAQRSHVLQQTVAQAVGDLRILNPTLMNPVSLVENHPSCRKNRDGQKVLPNGQSWRPQLLLLCFSIKILAEVGSLSKAPETFDHRKIFGLRGRSPPLPYLLSGLLQSRTHPKLASDQNGDNGDSDIDLADLSDSDQEEEEDDYDQLPPFKPLRKSQISKLSKEQKKAYFEEYDYRVKLLQKKQWKEELKRMRDIKKKGQPPVNDYGYMGEDDQENGSPAAVQVPLPDMALPPSFDGDNPAYRFRFLEPTSQFLARPVLDTHGWDHDCGYDGVNLEHSMAIINRFPAAVAVQITKDKKEFNIHLDSSVSAKHGENGSTMAGFDIQNIGRQLAYILRGETKFKNFRKNKTAAGVSVTFLGENVCPGLKLEDQITLGKRVVVVGSTGTVRSQNDTAFGANLEIRLREADFPIGQDQSSLGLSLVKWRGDTALGANFQSQFSVGRSYKMAVRAGINNKLSGQISVRTSSSDQLQIALIALLPVARAIYNSLRPGVAENYSTY